MRTFYKVPKYRYRFVITGGTSKPQKKIFNDYSDNRARAKLFRKLHQLTRGGKIILYRWDEKNSTWRELPYRVGKD
jgi:hypothetical protein